MLNEQGCVEKRKITTKVGEENHVSLGLGPSMCTMFKFYIFQLESNVRVRVWTS